MKDYKYIYIGIPTINGEIYGFPKLYFSNLIEDKYTSYLQLLDFFNFQEAIIYVIDTIDFSFKEIK